MTSCYNLGIEQLKKLLNGERISPYTTNKNLISIYDDDKFLLEIYEFTNSRGENLYSSFDVFDNLIDVLKYCFYTNSENTSIMYRKLTERNC